MTAREAPHLPDAEVPPAPPGLGEDAGPHPVVRAGVGLLLGAAAGAVAALLIPRPPHSRPTD